MKPEFNNTIANIKKQLNVILLNSTFAETVNPCAQISTMITFPEDIDIIKSRIKQAFKYVPEQDITNMTPNELVTDIYAHNPNFRLRGQEIIFKQHVKTEQNPATDKDNNEWTRRSIFTYIIVNISRAMGRTVQSTERISDLMTEAAMSGDDLYKLNYKLKELENFFGIKIDQSMKIYNAANAAEVSFIAQGRAPAHEEEGAKRDPLWHAIMTATSVKYLKSVLLHDLNVHISTYALLQVKSYEEFKALVQTKQQMRQK